MSKEHVKDDARKMLTFARRSLRPRDAISVSKIDHKTNKPVSKDMDAATLFKDAGACILMPYVDEGPLCMSKAPGDGRRC